MGLRNEHIEGVPIGADRDPTPHGIHTTPDNITHINPRDPDGEPDPARPWVIRIHPWLYNAIVRRGDILAVHPDYFQLTGELERWLYRLARKAVPDKAHPPAIRFKMETLHERSGVTRDLKRLAFDIRKIAETQPLPEYGVTIEYRKGRRELVTLYRDQDKPCRPPRGRRLKTTRGEKVEPAILDAYLESEDISFVIKPTPEPPTSPAPPAPERSSARVEAARRLKGIIRMLDKQLDATGKRPSNPARFFGAPGEEAIVEEMRRLLREAGTRLSSPHGCRPPPRAVAHLTLLPYYLYRFSSS